MYKIQSYQSEEADVFGHHLYFNADHEVFGAHFPGNPIVPGAVLIDVVRSAASDVLGKEMRVVDVKNAKFVTVIVPHSDVMLNITSRYAQAQDGFLFKSVISDSEKIYAKFDLIVKEEMV